MKTEQSTNDSVESRAYPLPSEVTKVIIGDTSTRNPIYMRDTSGEVVKIPFGDGFLIPQQNPIEPYAVVQEESVRQSLLNELYPIPQSSENGLVFSGVLSEQFYLNKENQLVLYTLIICHDCTVLVSTNGSVARAGDEYRYIPPTNVVTDIVVKRPEYVKHIYSLMRIRSVLGGGC